MPYYPALLVTSEAYSPSGGCVSRECTSSRNFRVELRRKPLPRTRVNKGNRKGRNPKAPARRCRTLPLTPPRGEEALRRDDEGERLAGGRIHQLLRGSGSGYQLALQPLPVAPSYKLRPR